MSGHELLQNALTTAERRRDLSHEEADDWRNEGRRMLDLSESVVKLRRRVRDFIPDRLGDEYDGYAGAVEGALRAASQLLNRMQDLARASAAFYRKRAGV